MEGCDCKNIPPNKHYYKDHIQGCPNLGFNRRASLWFRKIAAMHRALDISKEKGYERIVFIDSDVVFKKSITDEFLDKIFSNAGFFFSHPTPSCQHKYAGKLFHASNIGNI